MVLDVSEILESVDIVSVIEKYVDLEEKNGEYWGLSPFKDEKTPSFSVRKETGRFYCFASGIGGNAITFLRYYHHISSHEAVEMLKSIAGISDDSYTERKRMSSYEICKKYSKPVYNTKESSLSILPDDYMDRFENKPDKYDIWRKEGITDEALDFFGVRYDGFSNCLVYPIRDLNGNIVNVGGRTLDPDFKNKGIRKYTYFKQWGGQMSVVYGLFENYNHIIQKREVIIFEGMKSVLIARSYGINNTAAILTSHLNPGQMKILARLGVRVVFALDKDVKVKQDRNIASLKRYINVEYIYDFKDLLDDKDSPVDKGKEVFTELYNSRIKYK